MFRLLTRVVHRSADAGGPRQVGFLRRRASLRWRLQRAARHSAFVVWARLRPVTRRGRPQPEYLDRTVARLFAGIVTVASRSLPRTRGAIGVVALAVGVLGVAAWRILPADLGSTLQKSAAIGGAFNLVAQDGREVTDATFRDKWLLVFFGYTFCPDVCPTTLHEIAATLDRLGRDAASVQPLFVSVDPERDTPQVLVEYTGAFDRRILGLTGSAEQIAAAAETYRAYYRRVDGDDRYTIDHTAIIYVMGPDGRFITHFGYPPRADRMSDQVRKLIHTH